MKSLFDFFQNEEEYKDLPIEEASQRLSKAIQCKTISDCEDETPFLQIHKLIKESYPNLLANSTFELVDRSVLITLKGSDENLKPALFMSHLDVVPVVEGTEKDWTFDAYSGKIENGYIWGRGTQDIKQQVFAALEAIEYLLSHNKKPQRTIYFAFGQDEETFGKGAKAISDLLKERGVRLEFLLDEGGADICSGKRYGAPNTYVSTTSLMEKGYADLKLSVKSKGGHSSRPFGGTSLEKLSRAITRICDNPFKPTLCKTIKESFNALLPYISEEPLKTFLLNNDEEALLNYCASKEDYFQSVLTTIAPTMIMGSSSAPNVMPQNMEAVINFRLAPGFSKEELMAHCKKVVNDDSVELSFIQANPASNEAKIDGFGYKKLMETMHHFIKDVVFIPSMTFGGTDARSYEQICDSCLRGCPVMTQEDDHAAHGTNERITIRAYAQGIRILIHLMENTCFN